MLYVGQVGETQRYYCAANCSEYGLAVVDSKCQFNCVDTGYVIIHKNATPGCEGNCPGAQVYHEANHICMGPEYCLF